MDYLNKNIIVLGLVICIGLSNNILSAQSNCLKGCKKEVVVGENAITFSYELYDEQNVKIDFGKNKKYKLEEIADNSKLKIKLYNLPEGYEFIFKREWVKKSEALQILPVSKPIGKHQNNNFIPLKINPKYTKNNSVLKFAVRKKGEPSDVKPNYSLEFLFESLTSKPIEKPIAENSKNKKEDSNTKTSTDDKKEKVTNPPTDSASEEKINNDQGTFEFPIQVGDKKQELVKVTPSDKNGIDTIGESEKAEVLFKHDKNPEVTKDSKKEPKKKSKRQIERERKKEQQKKEAMAWKEATEKDTKLAFEEFKLGFPESERKVDFEIALRSNILQDFPQKNGNGYSVNLKNVFGLYVDTAYYSFDSMRYTKSDVDFDYNIDLFAATVNIKNIKEEKNIEIVIVDSIKKVLNRDTIKLGNHLEEPILDTLDGRIQQITFKGGKRPYQLYFLQNNKIVKHEVIDIDSITWIPPSNYFEDNKLYGAITFQISDSELSQPRTNEEWKINIPKKENFLLYYLGGLLAFLFLIVIIFFIRGKLRTSKKNNLETKMKPDLEKVEEPKMVKKIEVVPTKIEEGGNAYNDNSSKANNSKIKITGFKKANEAPRKNESELETYLKSEKCYSFDTTIFWEDSTISKVIFSEKSIDNLDKFLREQNLNPFLKEEEGQIPEIGGILLGTPFLSEKDKTYRVLVEEFVPIDPEYHDKYQLEFSPQSMAKDLGDIQDNFPKLLLVGWFHTHPGHGLFLSKPDLRIHDTFFRELYQFAMEIDSISERLDTGFFARRQDGKVNNKKDMIDGVKWYSWKEKANQVNS